MDKIYDNGTVMLGNVKKIKDYTERLFKDKRIDEEEYLDIKKELSYFEDNQIIAINYDCGMGLSIEDWSPEDVIKEDL